MTSIITCRRYRSVGSFQFRANFANAASPIMVRFDDDDEWQSTPFQVADAQHSARAAERLVARYLSSRAG